MLILADRIDKHRLRTNSPDTEEDGAGNTGKSQCRNKDLEVVTWLGGGSSGPVRSKCNVVSYTIWENASE